MSDLWTRKSTHCCYRSDHGSVQAWKDRHNIFKAARLEEEWCYKGRAGWLDILVWVAKCNLQVPIWAEVYEAFPPRYEPRWDATDPVVPVRKILYREDSVRAQYSKVPQMLHILEFTFFSNGSTFHLRSPRCLVTMRGLTCFPTQNLRASAL